MIHLGKRLRNERLVQLEHGELGGVKNLVAELAVALHAKNLQVDVST